MTQPTAETPVPTTPLLSDKIYDFIKKLVQIFIPAFSSLYFGLAQIWGLPSPEQVVGTLALLATFFGAFLVLAKRSYNASDAPYDGEIVVSTDDSGKTLYSLELKGEPADIDFRKAVNFKVVNHDLAA